MGAGGHGLSAGSVPELLRMALKSRVIKDLWLPGLDSNWIVSL